MIGRIGNENVVVLIDYGSIHNFLDPSIDSKTKLQTNCNMHLSVKIANREVIHNNGFCDGVRVKLQGYQFLTSFYVLALGGCDIVLGVKWLETLGSIILDFSKMSMEFNTTINRSCYKGRGYNSSHLRVRIRLY